MHEIINEDAKQIAEAKLDWSKLEGKTVFIAGATGYVPQNFVHGLLKRNDLFDSQIKVIALCRNKEKANYRFGEYNDRKDFEIIIQDVCEPINYKGKIDYIIHAASPAGIKHSFDDYMVTYRTNVIGCDNLIQLANQNKAVILFISSIDIYGKSENIKRFEEDMIGFINPLDDRAIYANAKRACETFCLAYAKNGGKSVIVRPSQILGNGIPLDDGRLHIDFINQMLKGNKITLKGDGAPIRSFIYVVDAITGILTAMLNGNSGEAYNIMDERNELSVLQLAELMASQIKDRKILIEYDMESRKNNPEVTKVVNVVCGCSEKIKDLGWKPLYDAKTACHRMMEFYGLEV